MRTAPIGESEKALVKHRWMRKLARYLCLSRSKLSWMELRRNWAVCGGFFDVPSAQKRQAELDALMSAESFWNNREQAQKLIDEAATLRKKVDPLVAAEKQLEDIKTLVELAEGEPESSQLKLEQEVRVELKRFNTEVDAFELRSLLSGPH